MISDRFKQMREALGKTQTEFGVGIGVSRSVIKNIEYGVTQPTKLFLNHLCEVYNVNLNWLETGEGEMFTADPAEARIQDRVQSSPAMQSLLAAWDQLGEPERDAFVAFARKFVADYAQRMAAADDAHTKSMLEDADASAPDADRKQA